MLSADGSALEVGRTTDVKERSVKGTWRLRGLARRLSWVFRSLDDSRIVRKDAVDSEARCPVCEGTAAKSIGFGRAGYVNGPSAALPEVQTHRKYLCSHCGHLFTPWLDGDLQQVSAKYGGIYGSDQLYRENERAAFQLGLIQYALKHLGRGQGVRVLDFGCGPNISPTKKMRDRGYDVRCCDILEGYPYDGEVFFRYRLEEARWFGSFDAIVSIDVMEHLGDTVSAWRNLNRLLKPGGMMAHCFPTRMHYSLRHACCSTPFHTCIFSWKSLQILTGKTGFRLEAIDSFNADVPFVFRFRKN
jgi:SAM-dependent methyltransferase